MTETRCGKRIRPDCWPCILRAGHEEPWHMTPFGHSWLRDDPPATDVRRSEYRTGNHWGVTIVREGIQPPNASGKRPDAELVAVVVNGDQDLAERICALLNGGEAVQLLEYALQLRIHGERAPGGNESWSEFDRRCEDFLRRQLRCQELNLRPDEHAEVCR